MSASRLRTALIVASASIGLTGCVGAYGPMGGVSVGYGNGGYYDPYYGGYGYGGYGYGGYGRSPYGYGYPGNYYGWYDNHYYPGSGYYVYDRYGNRYRWSDRYRRYWESRRGDAKNAVTPEEFIENWSGYRQGASGTRTTNRVRTSDRVAVQQRSVRTQEERQQAREQRRQELRQQLRNRIRPRSSSDDGNN